MSTHTIWIKDARFRQSPQVTPEQQSGGPTTPTNGQKEANVNNSMGNAAAAAGAAYLAGKIVNTATQIGMYQIEKIGSRNGNTLQQIRIQNTLNKIGIGSKGLSYGKAALAGAAAGAAVGTFIFPGIGTAVGAGVGALIGLASTGINDAINYDRNRYERLRNNYEIGQFEKLSIWTNGNNRFAGVVS